MDKGYSIHYVKVSGKTFAVVQFLEIIFGPGHRACARYEAMVVVVVGARRCAWGRVTGLRAKGREVAPSSPCAWLLER